MLKEFERIKRIQQAVGDQASVAGGGRWTLGMGDDAAVFYCQGMHWLSSVDTQVQGVHFRPGWLSWFELGYRATMAAASDLAAMGARPAGMLSSLIFPASFSENELEQLAAGQAEAGNRLTMPLVGGNLTSGHELSVSTTVFGTRRSEPIRRSGAKAGDRLWLLGECGLAAAGLAWLQQQPVTGDAVETQDIAVALRAWRRPEALCETVLQVAEDVHAAIDISDGLSSDGHHLAEASAVDLVLDSAALVSDPLARVAQAMALDPMQLACHGGEDYGVLLAVPAEISLAQGRVVGRCRRPQGEHGCLWLDLEGNERKLERKGYEHFADPQRT